MLQSSVGPTGLAGRKSTIVNSVRKDSMVVVKRVLKLETVHVKLSSNQLFSYGKISARFWRIIKALGDICRLYLTANP